MAKSFVEYANQNVNGVQHPRVSFEALKKFKINIPPLNEQKRIVTKIEALQQRSRHAKTELEAIKPLLDQFRQSVLAAAFRGDLTRDWREKNIDIPWLDTTLAEIILDKPRNGYSVKAVDYQTNIKTLILSATTSGKFKPEYFKYLDIQVDENSYLWLQPKDILIQRSNTLDYVGMAAIYTGKKGDFIYPDTMMKIQVNQAKAIPEFVHYSLLNRKTRLYYRNKATGTAGNMPKINQPTVMNTPIPLPPLPEQQEIVRRLENLFKLADSMEQHYKQAANHLETLNQSILAKAFRGELVPQDPNDEPASVLLERIKAEKAKQEQPKRTPKKTSKKQPQQLNLFEKS